MKYLATMLYFVGKAGLTDYVDQLMNISNPKMISNRPFSLDLLHTKIKNTM